MGRPKAKREEYTFEIRIMKSNGKPKAWCELSNAEKEKTLTVMGNRLSQRMSDYYTNHAEEYRSI